MIFSLARKRTGLTLSQLGEQVGGMGYKTVFARIKYLETRMGKDAALREVYRHCKEQLAISETCFHAADPLLLSCCILKL
jgi:hypothetical protein